MDDGNIQYPLYRDNLFAKVKRIADYEKAKDLHRSITEMIETTQGKVERHQRPNNPRQDILQRCDKNNLRILLRQKQRLEDKMVSLERMIREDIDTSFPK